MHDVTLKPDYPRFARTIFLVLGIAALLLAAVAIWPEIDLAVSGLFYVEGKGFVLKNDPALLFLQAVTMVSSYVLGGTFLIAFLVALVRRGPVLALQGRSWLFLLLALLIGPVLVTNVVFKDHWGRARPREVTQFGGKSNFSSALIPQAEIRKNSSFISGDASFGFFLPALAYVVPLRRSRRVFWACIGAGSIFAIARLINGAHFLSDILFAVCVTTAVVAGVHTAIFGPEATRSRWRLWLQR